MKTITVTFSIVVPWAHIGDYSEKFVQKIGATYTLHPFPLPRTVLMVISRKLPIPAGWQIEKQ